MALLSPLSILLSALAFLGLVVTQRLRSPLRKLPGPPISKLSSLGLRWNEFKGDRTGYIHGLHKRYGPVVRIAPNEVAFATAAAVRDIYGTGGSGYDKTEFYNLFTIFGRRTMFTILNRHDHAKRKRILADRYANTSILRPDCIGGLHNRAEALVHKCWTSVGSSIDLYVALHSYAFDCVTHHLFHPHGSHSLERKFDEEIMREVTFDDSLHNRLVQYHYPTLHRIMNRVLRLVAKPRETPLADEFISKSCSRTDSSRFTLLSRLQDRGDGLDGVDIEAECLDHMAAGIDTTGDALCFLMWEISQPRSLRYQRRLQEEILKNPNTPVEDLPFLDALIHEGLRCFPAIPMSLPRYVPHGGRIIDGYFIPEKTIVSCQAYSVHRMDESVFPSPDAFNPERWLSKKGETERKRLFFAFSSGGRGCVGKHLALAEMRLALKELYSKFSTLPDPTMTADMMTMSHQPISSRPKGQKCLLRMVPVGNREM